MWELKVLKTISEGKREGEVWVRRWNEELREFYGEEKYSRSGESAEAEMAGTCEKNGKVKNAKNNNDKDSWGRKGEYGQQEGRRRR